MQPTRTDGRQKIDLETWERRSVFQFFKRFTEPLHGVCIRVDCTETFNYAKERGISVSLALMHRCLAAAHLVENFRTRIVDGSVWRYDCIHGAGAIGRPNGTIGFGYFVFHERIQEFVREASIEVERVRRREDIERIPDLNRIRFSTLPWLDLTSISHARDLSNEDPAPRITIVLDASFVIHSLAEREKSP